MANNGPGTPIGFALQAREKARQQMAGVSTPGNPRGPKPAPEPVAPAPERIKPKSYDGILRSEFGQDSITSGYRDQATQDDLVRRGKTKATRSSHTYQNGFDLAIGSAKSADEIRARMRARGINVTKVIRETGVGNNQGTGPHWHIEIDGKPNADGQHGGNNVPQIEVAGSAVPGPSGNVNTGVTNQSGRIMNSSGKIESQQQAVEGAAANAGSILDNYMSVLGQSQVEQMDATVKFTDAARNVNQQMMDATAELQARVKPVFATRQRVLDQLTVIQDMDPISRAVRGFFDLNYDQEYLMNTSNQLGAIVKEQGEMYSVMQGLHGDSIEALDRLHKLDTMLPGLKEAQANEMVKGSLMQVQRAMDNLGITMEGVQNESSIIQSQNLARRDLIGRLDGPTTTALIAQAEQSGGNVTYNGVQFSGQELRERGLEIENFEISNQNARTALASGQAELADKNAGRMMTYMTDSQIDEAIANGGTYEGVQIPLNALATEKANRTKQAIENVEVENAMSSPHQAALASRSAVQYGQQLESRGASVFGAQAFSEETRNYNLQITDVINRIAAESRGNKSPAVLGALNAQLAQLKSGYGQAISGKVNRLVGGDPKSAGYVSSYLLGDQVTPGAGAAMMVHFAMKGGLPAAMQTSAFGQGAMAVVMETTRGLATGKIGGKALTPAQIEVEAARLLSDPSSPQGAALRAATSGVKFQTTFSNLPSLATSKGQVIHPFGKFDRETFARLSRQADINGIAEIKGQYPDSEPPKGAIAAAQQRYLVDYLDQEAPISGTMSNSELMLDFLQSPVGQQRIITQDDASRNGGIGDWMAGSTSRGGLMDSMGNYTKGFADAVGLGQQQSKVESALIARTYRNDIPKRTLSILNSMPSLTRSEANTLNNAITKMLPQGTAEQQATQGARAPMRSETAWQSSLVKQQMDAVDNVILNHKFEDPVLERIRKKAQSSWVDSSRAAKSWADTLWNLAPNQD